MTVSSRRDFLQTTGAVLTAAAALPIAAAAQDTTAFDHARSPADAYLWGCGWNRDLPGVFGQACISFEMRAQIGGTGVGTLRDDVFADEVNSQFQITSAKEIRGGYEFKGSIIRSRNPDLVGKLVTIVAEPTAIDKARASLIVESEGDQLVVIAIIAILIGLLIPAIQK